MAVRQRIGLRQVRALKPGETICITDRLRRATAAERGRFVCPLLSQPRRTPALAHDWSAWCALDS
jgi:hypothetical protein